MTRQMKHVTFVVKEVNQFEILCTQRSSNGRNVVQSTNQLGDAGGLVGC